MHHVRFSAMLSPSTRLSQRAWHQDVGQGCCLGKRAWTSANFGSRARM